MAVQAVIRILCRRALPRFPATIPHSMSLDADAKKVLLRKIPHGLFVCGVREGDEVNGFTASWVTQGSFEPPLVGDGCSG